MSETREPSSAMSTVFGIFILGSVLFAAWTGRMRELTDVSFSSAKDAVTLAIGLIGIMALWLGLVRILEAGGFMFSLARAVRPIMIKLFPDVPPEHPAMSAMILNISANMLGLGNAATPFGVRAMIELNKLNPFPGMATNAMCLFLAINTSSVTILPLGVIGVRAAAGSAYPSSIFLPSLLATSLSTAVGILAALFLARRDNAYLAAVENSRKDTSLGGIDQQNEALDAQGDYLKAYSHLRSERRIASTYIAFAVLAIFLFILGYRFLAAPDLAHFVSQELFSYWLMPALMMIILLYGIARGVKIYEAVTEGAKQGFEVAVRIIPFLVAILVAIGMFRASGAMEFLVRTLSPFTDLVFMPAETLPMALVRPLSGSGAFGIMSSLVEKAPDSYPAFVSSVMMGSTETTFYVLAVYFGAVGIVRIRYALAAALLADATGILASCFLSKIFWAEHLLS